MSAQRFDVGLVDRVLVIRWRARPLGADMAAITSELANARRLLGAPLIQLELIGADIPPPLPAEIPEVMRHIRALPRLRERHVVVVEAVGAAALIVRGVFNGLSLLLPDAIEFCSSVDESLERIGHRLGVSPASLRAGLLAHGLLT